MSRIRWTGRFAIPALLVLLTLVFVAYRVNRAEQMRLGTDTHGAADTTDTRPGAVKMRERLAAYAAESKLNHTYFGELPVKELEKELANAGDSNVKKWRCQYLLGWHLLRLGRVEEAVARLEAARALVPSVMTHLLSGREKNIRSDSYGMPILGKETAFDLGIAYMRLAEVKNCCARHTPGSCILPFDGDAKHTDRDPARKAMTCFREVLSSYPDHLTSRWLLCVAAMAIGEYPAAVPEEYRMIDGALDSDEAFPHFADVAGSLGLDRDDCAGSVAIDDFDGDGDLDVITSSSDPKEALHYEQNEGDGTFTDRSHDAGFDGLLGGLNMVQADFDNDGDIDLVILRGAWWARIGLVPNSLLVNDGHGVFVDKTYEAGLADPAYPTQCASVADYDLDGDVDLFVGNETDPVSTYPSQLFRNNGDGTFTDVAKQAGVENLGFAKAAAWGDFDGDRDPDLYVSNLGNPNRLYRNNGDGTFTDIAESAGVTKPIRGFGTFFFDCDNDGNLDLYAASYWNQPQYAVAQFFGAKFDEAELAALYRGDGHGHFKDVAPAMNLVKFTMPMGINVGDLDNDGFPDFYLGTGYPNYEGIVPNFMYWNRGGRRFSDVSVAGGFSHLQKGHGIAFADFDNDGDQDVFEQMGGAFPGDGFADVLYENPGFGNHWLKVRLVGVESNRFGIGARIRCDVVEDGQTRSIFKWVNSGASFGCNPLRQEIGLGKSARVAHLEVYWPVSDTRQTFDDVPGDTGIEITEGAKDYRIVPIQPAAAR